MGLIYSKCCETKRDDDTVVIKEQVISKQHEKPPKIPINKTLLKKNSVSSLKVNNGSDRLSESPSEKEYKFINSEDLITPLIDFNSNDSPSFNIKKSGKNMLLENICLPEEERGLDPFLITDFSNISGGFDRFYYDDKNFDNPYLNSIENSCMNMYEKKINNKYVSMSNNSILIAHSRNNNNEVCDVKSITNLFNRKSYIVMYFELHYFMLWGGDYIKNVYPDTNLVLFAQLNDNVQTMEKIYLMNSDEEKFKYEPMLKKEDLDKKSYRVLKFLLDENSNNLDSKPIKLSIEICTYCNNKLLTISYEEFFFSSHSDTEMHKYILYPNTYMKYNNKKMGNLNFAFMFKLERLNIVNEDNYKELASKFLNMFSIRDRLITFKEDPSLQLNYYGIDNVQFRTLTGGNNFVSLKDIQVVEVDSFLKNENMSIDRLLELMSLDYISKYELFALLKRLHDVLCKKEFSDDKLDIFKEKIFKFLEEIKDRNEKLDKIIIPFMFTLVKRTFFKSNKNAIVQEKKTVKNKKDDKFTKRDIELIINIFNMSFMFVNPKFGPEISLSALNYINKNIEENIPLNAIIDKKRVNSEEFFLNFIVTKRKYIELCDLLLYMSDNPACALPVTIILSKILKSKKEQIKEVVSILKQDRFREVFKEMLRTHDCNSVIMTHTLSIMQQILDFIDINELFQIVDFSKLKEVFCIFKINGFDMVHDSIISLIKAILVKKSSAANKQSALTLPLADADYCEIILVFVNAIVLIRTRIMMFSDFNRLIKGLYNLLCHVYTICNVINNINEKNELKAHQVCIEKKMPELLIECLNTLNEKKVFTFIDNGFDKFDISSVNTKMIIFRTLYHCIMLIQNLRKIDQKIIPKLAAEKFYKVIKIIEDNDAIYNPQLIMKNYARFKGKVDEQFKGSVKNLLEYYNRYKQKLPEIAEDLITILKS